MSEEGRYTFKNLELWKLAQALGTEVSKLADDLPQKRSADITARQLIRSASSIAANIAEGHGRYTLPAYRNHLSIAKGSASECKSWIDLLVRLGYIPQEQGHAIEQRCVTLIAGLTRRITALEAQKKGRRIREEGPEYEVEPNGFQGSGVPGLDGLDGEGDQ